MEIRQKLYTFFRFVRVPEKWSNDARLDIVTSTMQNTKVTKGYWSGIFTLLICMYEKRISPVI